MTKWISSQRSSVYKVLIYFNDKNSKVSCVFNLFAAINTSLNGGRFKLTKYITMYVVQMGHFFKNILNKCFFVTYRAVIE